MFNLFAELPATKADYEEHIGALEEMYKSPEDKELFKHLYDCLSILDSKSTSLLTFNSVIIAVFAIFTVAEPLGVAWIAIAFGMAMTLVSCLLLLWVVWIHWSTTDDLKDKENHPLTLLRVRRSRTVLYRLAWYFSVAGISGLLLFFAYHIFHFFCHCLAPVVSPT